MFGWWRRPAAAGAVALAATVLLGGCAAPRYTGDTIRPTLLLDGPSAAFTIGRERFAVAAFGPPASLLLVRAGPVYFWATPAPGLHDLYVQERVHDRPVADHVLVVDRGGRVDCTYTLRWDS